MSDVEPGLGDRAKQKRTPAPRGDLATFTGETFTHRDRTRRVFRKGEGPAVLVITEMPGISPMVLGFADRVVAVGCTAVLPDLFGRAGRDPTASSRVVNAVSAGATVVATCISRDFTALAVGRSSRVVDWLRALARTEHARCGGPGVGVVGMCFTGGFALAMAVDDTVLAPVLSQPSLPFPISRRHRAGIDISDADLDIVAGRCAAESLRVIGLRFEDDPFVPAERFATLKQRLGAGFVEVKLAQADGNPDGPLGHRHSVLTGDLIDEPGERTRDALDTVLEMLRTTLTTIPDGG
jgi:dienelactone hydrolase